MKNILYSLLILIAISSCTNSSTVENRVVQDSLLNQETNQEATSTSEIYPEIPVDTVFGFENIKSNLNDLADYKIELMVETSISIMNDGAHCDLTEWKHGYSEWLDITEEMDSISGFKVGEFDEGVFASKYNYYGFPDCNLMELKKYALEHCDESFTKIINAIVRVGDDFCGVSASRYILKLSGYDGADSFERYYIYDASMGC